MDHWNFFPIKFLILFGFHIMHHISLISPSLLIHSLPLQPPPTRMKKKIKFKEKMGKKGKKRKISSCVL